MRLRCLYILALIGQPYIFAKRGNAMAECQNTFLFEPDFPVHGKVNIMVEKVKRNGIQLVLF